MDLLSFALFDFLVSRNLLCLSSWCLVIVVCLFLTRPQVCLQFVIVVFPDHTHLLLFCLSCFRVCSLLPCGHLLGKS